MILERPYMAPVCERDPHDDCYACDGRAFRRWFDVDLGPICLACAACESTATAGQFVVQLVTAKFRYEFRYQSAYFERARAKAERVAAMFANRPCLGQPVREIRVVFKPHLSTLVKVSDEVVERIQVKPRTLIAA